MKYRILIVFVRGRVVIAFDDFHYKWYKGIDENVTAIVVLAPLFKEIDEFLS